MNVNIQPPRIGPQPWRWCAQSFDQALPFANMRETPYYRDAVYEQFSKQEYARRYARCAPRCASTSSTPSSCRAGRATGASAAACCGSPAIGNGTRCAATLWCHFDASRTMIYSMGGTARRGGARQVAVAVTDVRHSRNGRYADIMVSAARAEARRGRIGLMEIDPRTRTICRSQYNVLAYLPDAELVFTKASCTTCSSSTARRSSPACARRESSARTPWRDGGPRQAWREGIRAARAAGAAISRRGDIDF